MNRKTCLILLTFGNSYRIDSIEAAIFTCMSLTNMSFKNTDLSIQMN